MDYHQTLDFIKKAHKGQFRRDGAEYWTHPFIVASSFNTEDERIVALLHDTIEDTSVTEDTLKDLNYPCHIVRSVLRLTKRPGQSYKEYIANIARDRCATKVKIADILHNTSDQPPARQLDKYHKGIRVLLASL